VVVARPPKQVSVVAIQLTLTLPFSPPTRAPFSPPSHLQVKLGGGLVDVRCFGLVLHTNSSALLVHLSGHALEVTPTFASRRLGMPFSVTLRVLQAAQWVPREHAVTWADPARPRERCRFTNAPVAAVPAEAAGHVGDGCSRFLRAFCSEEWRGHPLTRHLGAFTCRYPDDSDSAGSEGWRLAQTVGSDRGLCPDPALVLWPPSKVTYPLCSAAIARLSRDHGVSLNAHLDASDGRAEDALSHLQALALGECPPPQHFRWSPDATLWPDCDRWLRTKCAPGSACDVGATAGHTWASAAAQRSFADAQNWAAGRGMCPGTLEGRWRPGRLFFPGCSSALLKWCQSRGAVAECARAPVAGRAWRRSEAQKWVHATLRACPDPELEFAWPWGLGEGAGTRAALPETAALLPEKASGRIRRSVAKGSA
jgi:hypothetical protein